MAKCLLKGGYRISTTLLGTAKTSLLSGPLRIQHLQETRMQPFSEMTSDISTKGNWKNLVVEEIKPFVYNVQLNRPKKMNALTKELWGEIGGVFQELDCDPDCRVIVLSGNGKMFCAGIDLSTLMEIGQTASIDGDVARKAKLYYPIIRQFQNHHMAIEKCQKPVILSLIHI